jgi:HK97 family phage major capsid protein
MAEGVYQGVEHQAISGDGTGENMVGVLHTAGTTQVPFNTDVPTSLRGAVTALQNLGEDPTGWVFHPNDAETLDLLRWGSAGGLLTGGVENDNGNGFGTSDNILGTARRVISPSVPQGTAILADWRQLKLFLNSQMMILANAFGDSLFQTNSVQLRGELLTGIGVLRPQAFAIVDLTSGGTTAESVPAAPSRSTKR